jgi:hypothetical protein
VSLRGELALGVNVALGQGLDNGTGDRFPVFIVQSASDDSSRNKPEGDVGEVLSGCESEDSAGGVRAALAVLLRDIAVAGGVEAVAARADGVESKATIIAGDGRVPVLEVVGGSKEETGFAEWDAGACVDNLAFNSRGGWLFDRGLLGRQGDCQ